MVFVVVLVGGAGLLHAFDQRDALGVAGTERALESNSWFGPGAVATCEGADDGCDYDCRARITVNGIRVSRTISVKIHGHEIGETSAP